MKKHKKQSSKSSVNGSIRIIAGQHRGRKLPVIMAEGLRPTTDRVKETVFNWLMPYIHNRECLDCFSGSGGLGFEALSRGANNVTFLEYNKQAANQLKQNVQLLKANNVTVEHVDSLHYLKTVTSSFNLVFIDPPFRKDFVEQTLQLLTKGWLTDDAIVYIEMESECNYQPSSENWQLLKEKTAGQVSYRLYQYRV